MHRAVCRVMLGVLGIWSVSCAGSSGQVKSDGSIKNPAPFCPQPKVAQYNRYFCCDQVQEQREPADAREAAAIVRDALLHTSRHIRVLGAAHTGQELICTDGLVLRTTRMKQIIGLQDVGGEKTVVAEAGVTVGELNRWLHARGYTLSSGTLEFRDATLAGAVATAAHGSTLAESSVLSSRVRGLWIVTPSDVASQGERYTEPPETTEKAVDATTWRALRANLGALGMVTKLRLAVEKDYALRVRIRYESDQLLWRDGGVAALMKDCAWGQIYWFPRANRIVQACGTRSDDPAEHRAENTLLNPRASTMQVTGFQAMLKAMAWSKGRLCPLERLSYLNFKLVPPQRKGDARVGTESESTSTAVGPAWSMMSSELTPLQAEVPQNDFEIALPMTHAGDVLLRLKDDIERKRICLPFVGAFLRFTRADESTLVGHAASDGANFAPGTPVMFVELVAYRPSGRISSDEDDYFRPYWEAAYSLLDRGGRPHWAKNHKRFFLRAKDQDSGFRARLAAFRSVADQLDPQHRFANEFTDSVGLTSPRTTPPASL